MRDLRTAKAVGAALAARSGGASVEKWGTMAGHGDEVNGSPWSRSGRCPVRAVPRAEGDGVYHLWSPTIYTKMDHARRRRVEAIVESGWNERGRARH